MSKENVMNTYGRFNLNIDAVIVQIRYKRRISILFPGYGSRSFKRIVESIKIQIKSNMLAFAQHNYLANYQNIAILIRPFSVMRNQANEVALKINRKIWQTMVAG